MANFLRVDVDGHPVLIETEPVNARQPAASDVTMRGGRGPAEVAEEAQVTLDAVLSRVGPLVRQVSEQVREAAASADEIRVEFGIKVSADAHVIVAHAGGEATLQIALTWHPQEGRRL